MSTKTVLYNAIGQIHILTLRHCFCGKTELYLHQSMQDFFQTCKCKVFYSGAMWPHQDRLRMRHSVLGAAISGHWGTPRPDTLTMNKTVQHGSDIGHRGNLVSPATGIVFQCFSRGEG